MKEKMLRSSTYLRPTLKWFRLRANYGFEPYHVLVNPSHSLVQTVLTSMVESVEYFFFAFAASERLTAFPFRNR